jgi:SNF2 family DNA or RNA helicase
MLGTADVYVASYGTARRDAVDTNPRHSPLIALRAGTVIADEVHMLKHQDSAQSKAVRRLASRAAAFVGLSGTPITHSPADLWPAAEALEPGAWPSRERWVSRYCPPLPGDYRPTPLGLSPHTEPEFRTTLLGRHRRIAKADVLAELPPKVHSVRTVDLPPAYRAAYDGMEADMLAQLPDGEELSVMSVLAQIGRLSQLASAAADIATTVEVVEDPATGLPVEKVHQKVTLKAPSWKVDALLEVLAERPGQPVVTFAPSRQLIVLAGQAATAAGLKVGYIVGGQTPRERTAVRESFQRGELDLACVTTGAGGVGLTLTASSTAVFLQRPWSLVEAMQAEDRLHRIGAEGHESIDVIDVVARNTIDTRVRAVLRERAGQLADLVQDPRIVAELLGGAEVRDLRRKKAAA